MYAELSSEAVVEVSGSVRQFLSARRRKLTAEQKQGSSRSRTGSRRQAKAEKENKVYAYLTRL